MGSGNPKREFLHVDDLADACEFVLKNWIPDFNNSPLDVDGKILPFLNVGSGVDLSIFDLASLIAEVTRFKGQIIWDKSKPDGTPRKNLNVVRINKIGWKSKIDLIHGLESTFEDLKNQYSSQSIRAV